MNNAEQLTRELHDTFSKNEFDKTLEFTAHGTHNGTLHTPGGPIPPTGKTVNFIVAEFMAWENGKLLSLNNYQDAGSIMRQIGAM